MKAYNPGFDYAKRLIHEDKAVRDDRDAWSEDQPSAAQENAFIEEHGIEAYGRWHLAVDDELNPTGIEQVEGTLLGIGVEDLDPERGDGREMVRDQSALRHLIFDVENQDRAARHGFSLTYL